MRKEEEEEEEESSEEEEQLSPEEQGGPSGFLSPVLQKNHSFKPEDSSTLVQEALFEVFKVYQYWYKTARERVA